MVNIGLVAEDSSIWFDELVSVASALQIQVIRDFGPLWNVTANVLPYHKLEDVPAGTWPLVIMDSIDNPGAEGIHQDQNGLPISLVKFDSGWTLTASHECLEMLADPNGDRMKQGLSPVAYQGTVDFLCEVCDPCEDPSFAYEINGIVVSDFILPAYYGNIFTDMENLKYDFTENIKKPFEIPQNGYISWKVGDVWFQRTNFGKDVISNLGTLSSARGSVRAQLNGIANAYDKLLHIENTNGKLVKSTAAHWRDKIQEILAR